MKIEGGCELSSWECVLQLNAAREVIGGSQAALVDAVRNGADLRIYTEFLHNEHVDVTSADGDLVQEVAEFAVTYVVDHRWVAGLMNLRQPVQLPAAFGPRPSMSFFLYNQDGTQAIARPFLDGFPMAGLESGASTEPAEQMPKFHLLDQLDVGTNAPSENFVYDFEVYRFLVRPAWREVLQHDASGQITQGSLADLVASFTSGSAIKVAVSGFADRLCTEGHNSTAHEVLVQVGSAYYYTETELFVAGTHPLIRVRPGVPLRYTSGGWDFGWLLVRSDGQLVYRRYDPYTLTTNDEVFRGAVRWFVC